MSFVRLCIAATLAIVALPQPAVAQSAAPPTVAERLSAAAIANRHRLEFDGTKFSGAAWDCLLEEGRSSQMFLLGEEHGIAENAMLATALFSALAPSGYSKLVIEVSPPMADLLDASARGGIEGLHRQFAIPGGEPAFFGMKEEAEMLVAVRAAVSGDESVFWGVDYEVGGDGLLISNLAADAPESASRPMAVLLEAAREAQDKYKTSGDISLLLSFSGDPALVRALRDAWPVRNATTDRRLDALEETMEINRLWVERRGFDSNQRRADFLRANFLGHWKAATAAGQLPRVFAKLGASHLIRGRNPNEVFDIGTLAPELAQAAGGRAFHLMVLPGRGSPAAVLNPARWVYEASSPKDDYMRGLDPVTGAAFADAFTLIDLRPLRPILGHWRVGTDPELMRVVHGFDMILVMSGSTASANLREPVE